MSSSKEPNDDEVNQFLQRMRTLSDKRDQQDAERVKKLEEDLIQGRSERLARRAERARSLSPDKPNTPQSLRSAIDSPRSIRERTADTPTPVMEPPKPTAHDESLRRLNGSPAQTPQEDELKKPGVSAAALGRSGTLSWNRRPQHGSTHRPMSMVLNTPDRSAAASPHENPKSRSPERVLSRDQIAQSLGAKDPSWFKQTAERGSGSPALRRNQEDTDAGAQSGKMQLPGMSRESTVEPDLASPPAHSDQFSVSARSSGPWLDRYSNTSTSTADTELTPSIKSPLPTLEAHKLPPPAETVSEADGADIVESARGFAMLPTHGRISPEHIDRPASPTKGMGGFVQSAMLKRSDSLNKRWSAQAPQSLTRHNSILSNRGGPSEMFAKPEVKSSSVNRDVSTERQSRPGSSSSNATITKTAELVLPQADFVKPALPYHTRKKSAASNFGDDATPRDEVSPPSPSKRWSPNKSSWLESALSKPDSPKPLQPPPQQPPWMAEINKAKQHRGSVDMSKGSPFQSAVADSPNSGRTSPIKDVQLRPVSLRKVEHSGQEGPPNEQRKPTPNPTLLKAKPEFSAKPQLATGSQPKILCDINNPDGSETAPLTTTTLLPTKSARSSATPKPETPPKKDFRANLKSRNNVSETSKQGEFSEFQNVFGKLKRAETKNYVAPDTLKSNILQGKQGLAVTGGPKPSARRDEFKESLRSQKSIIELKAQQTGSAALKKSEPKDDDTKTPEAMLRRKTLSRHDVPSKLSLAKEPSATPEGIMRARTIQGKEPMKGEVKNVQTVSRTSIELPKSSKLADRFNPALANVLARGPTSVANPLQSPTSSAGTLNATTSTPIARTELTHMTKGRARGPKRRTPGNNKNDENKVSATLTMRDNGIGVTEFPTISSDMRSPGGLSEMTTSLHNGETTTVPARQSLKAKPSTPAKSPELTRSLDKSNLIDVASKPSPLQLGPKTPSGLHTIPQISPLNDINKTPTAPSISSPSPFNKSSQDRLPRPKPPLAVSPLIEPLQESAPKNANNTQGRDKSSPEKLAFSVKDVTALWGRSPSASSPVPGRARSPIKLPTKADEEAAMESAGLQRSPSLSAAAQPEVLTAKPKPMGLGFGSLGNFAGLVANRTRASTPKKPLSPKPTISSPSIKSDRPQSEPPKPLSRKSQGMFSDFFDEEPVTAGELPSHIDVMGILQSPPFDILPSSKTRTLRKQIQEVTADGTLASIPIQEEHILFQDAMYLCTHIFGDSTGARHTEVYLWSGNSVSEPDTEDVLPFARNHAKQNQGKLITMRQGKEVPNFFHALGGIAVTRRTRPASKNYVLCGRRHLGHLAFDEVDFTPKSLSSAYPFIISTERGKVYLWKGRGASLEELSGARLMGMDLTPSGQLDEMDEGAEPPNFFSIFPPTDSKGPPVPRSADHWRYKPRTDRYRPRLFKMEEQQVSGWGSLQVSAYLPALLRRPSWGSLSGDKSTERPQTPLTPKSSSEPVTKVVEIMPFCQHDLEPEYIYVLDAFFEMYIIVGSLSRSQASAFSTALLLAQEYSILAASEEDRPFVPITTIVLEGTPRDMKAAFRFWDDAMIPAAGLMRGKLGRGKSLRIVSLQQAIEATRR